MVGGRDRCSPPSAPIHHGSLPGLHPRPGQIPVPALFQRGDSVTDAGPTLEQRRDKSSIARITLVLWQAEAETSTEILQRIQAVTLLPFIAFSVCPLLLGQVGGWRGWCGSHRLKRHINPHATQAGENRFLVI